MSGARGALAPRTHRVGNCLSSLTFEPGPTDVRGMQKNGKASPAETGESALEDHSPTRPVREDGALRLAGNYG